MMEVITMLFALTCSDQPVGSRPEDAPALATVKRIYVDKLTGGETAAQMRDMIISSLQNSKLFVITEKEERADAFLRGAADDISFVDRFSSTDSLNAHGSLSTGSEYSPKSGTRSGAKYAGVSVGQNESTHIEERKHEATAAVRLVDKNGDVIWSTTQESGGGKFRGASADVAERITRQLVADFEKARKK